MFHVDDGMKTNFIRQIQAYGILSDYFSDRKRGRIVSQPTFPTSEPMSY